MTTPDTSGGARPPEGDMGKIRHTKPAFGGDEPVPVVDSGDPEGLPVKNKIRAFETKRRHEEEWNRTPNTTGTGAIHVKTFHSKLTDDALRYLDQTINEWLDAHPQYEVKFVNSSVGVLTAKLKEPHLICQVWV